MSGVKGRSGRKTTRDEEKRLKIIDKAWDLVYEKLQSSDTGKYLIAKDIVLKDITVKLEGKGFGGTATVVIFRNPKAIAEEETPRIVDGIINILDEAKDTSLLAG